MPLANTRHQPVIKTERGLTVAGTRITLYQVMDFIQAGWPAKLIRDRLQLTDEQIEDVMAYLEANSEDVKREYESVLKNAEKNRAYWEERNQEQLSRIASSPSQPGMEDLRAKLQTAKSRLGMS